MYDSAIFPFVLPRNDQHPEVDEGKRDIEPQDTEHVKPLLSHPACRHIDDCRLDDPTQEEESDRCQQRNG